VGSVLPFALSIAHASLSHLQNCSSNSSHSFLIATYWSQNPGCLEICVGTNLIRFM